MDLVASIYIDDDGEITDRPYAITETDEQGSEVTTRYASAYQLTDHLLCTLLMTGVEP